MNFAKNLLKKYGWEEGQGLGKNSDGISVLLRPNLKFDTAGLGENKAAEFNNHWWERVFNDAANNINVNKGEENVQIEITSKDAVEITTNAFSARKMKKEKGKGKYNYFVKKSVLNGLEEKSERSGESESEEDGDLPKYRTLTDEELFAACGGRTAHKGARHGLNLTGKLSRIERQERELLQKMQDQDGNDWTVVKSKKKRKREGSQVDNNADLHGILFTNEYYVKSKKKKKNAKQLDDELSVALNCVEIEAKEVRCKNLDQTTTSLHDKKRGEESVTMLDETSNNSNDVGLRRTKRKKKKYIELTENSEHDTSKFLKPNEIKLGKVSKKKRKKMHKLMEDVTGECAT